MSNENEDNNQGNEIEEEQNIDNYKRRKSIRIIALVTAICLGIMIMGPIFTNLSLPSLEFLKESSQLTQKPEIKEFQKSIVTIMVDNKRGTGFNIKEDGLIVTNAHVVEDRESVIVSFYKGEIFQGKVSKVYEGIDLALIEIEAKKLPKLALGERLEINEEDEVLIIGNPLHYEAIANKGVVVGLTKIKGTRESILLIDAPVNRGNSGSPVINDDGEVIGVIFATISDENFSDRKLGAAIPINRLNQILQK
ncbi:serine protease [Serpentinicella sp. ANB-PHB4]|uniref:S1C family serine protease n=1 Tax=Serpentinicella sp. ANB-PHB4 TaxID=3074076 RepID=UPI00285D782E|nr:serine protease [Serpentinicella sp. ANB-PHB4]MDR5658398.1 serine protease [Serpentinicella sp. ANB-PHB4]